MATINIPSLIQFLLFLISVSTSTTSLNLPEAVDLAMTQGGDDRIIIPPNAQCNKYFTAPQQKNGVIARSSSTSSSSSPRSFAAAQRLFNHLCAAHQTGNDTFYFTLIMEQIRARIKHLWGNEIPNSCYAITAPSGTDAEMLPAFAALARHPNWLPLTPATNPLVTNIVVASGEVGSGTALASGLHHFSKITPRGNSVQLGQPIAEVPARAIQVVEISIRDTNGTAIPLEIIEANIATMLKKAIIDDGHVAVLHMVHACKTGLGAPREDFIRHVKNEYGDALIVVIDAAQLRMNEEVTQAWLDNGYWVLLTGSKFLGGPSFSGAMLIPEHDALLLANVPNKVIPTGLSEYFSADDYDPIFVNLKATTSSWHNTGLALRWEAALATAEQFCLINQELRDCGINTWTREVRRMIQNSSHLQLLEELVDCGNASFDGFIGACNSVISFGIHINNNQPTDRQHFLTLAELRKIHEYLTQDLRSKIPALLEEESNIAATSCLIGQPVQIGTIGKCSAVLRIAIGAPQILPAIKKERLDQAVLFDEILENDRIVIQKLELIAKHWVELSS